MPVQEIIPKSAASLKPTQWVTDVNDQYIQYAIQDLLDTLADFQERNGGVGGVGLAANQIDYPEGRYPKGFRPPNLYVVSVTEKRAAKERAAGTPCVMIPPSVYINASMTPLPGPDGKIVEEEYIEACLSVMGFVGKRVPRYQKIKVEALNARGEKISVIVSGFEGRIHQHEDGHGRGCEYLTQLNFSEAELRQILSWIETIEATGGVVVGDLPITIIPEKLDCNSPAPMLGALKVWTEDALAKALSSAPSLGAIPPLDLKKSLRREPDKYPHIWGALCLGDASIASPKVAIPVMKRSVDVVKPAGNALLWAAAVGAGVAASVLLKRPVSRFLKDAVSSWGPKI